MLDPATRSIWAKSPNERGEWLPLYAHLRDAAGVAGWLWDHWLAPATRVRIATQFADETQSRTLATFLAGTHDIGKATPIFACADPTLAAGNTAAGLPPAADPQQRKHWPHATTGEVLLSHWLTESHDLPPAVSATWASPIGGHHGVPATETELSHIRKDHRTRLGQPRYVGAAPWQHARDQLLDRMWTLTGMDQVDPVALDQPSQVLIGALVIVADWIASNEDLFSYTDLDDPDRVTRALTALGLPEPWKADVTTDAAALFEDRFGFGVPPRPIQRSMVELANELPEPGLIICEAPMGEGKTEASLMGAEVLAGRFGCGGLMFSLPTQATTDGMFGRTMDWLDRLPDQSLPTGAAVLLGHGKARLNHAYTGLPDARDVGCDHHGPSVHPWLSGRKKSLFASICVTTVDQLLTMGLRRPHLAMQHLALSGKVIVLDEVHAYDAWMNSYLDRTLEWLGAYRVPVILLSATLPERRRRELLRAYTGRNIEIDATGYPLLTWATSTRSGSLVPDRSGRSSHVELDQLPTDQIAGHAARAAAQGANVLVIRNTVGEAVATAKELAGLTEHTSLHHSRFLAIDRASSDRFLLDRFGPDGHRPDGWVAVSTQVAEQSLDVDFDLLITDIAPIDLLLQRIGRLHRHRRPRPAGFETPRCLVTGIEPGDVPSFSRGSENVYGAWALLKTAAILQGHTTVTLPDDIPGLIELAYGADDWVDPAWTPELAAARLDMEARRTRQEAGADHHRLASIGTGPIRGWVHASADLDEAGCEAAVRDAGFSIEPVVLVRDATGGLCLPDWIDHPLAGAVVPTDRLPSAAIRSAMQSCTIRLGEHLFGQAGNGAIHRLASELVQAVPAAWANWHQPLLVLDARTLDFPVSAGIRLVYDANGHTGMSLRKDSH